MRIPMIGAALAASLLSGCAYTSPLLPVQESSYTLEVMANDWVQWRVNYTTESTSNEISGTGDQVISIGQAKQLGLTFTKVNGNSQYGTSGVLYVTLKRNGMTAENIRLTDRPNATEEVVISAYDKL